MEADFQEEECIHEVKADGRTVLLSSHIMAEVETLGDCVSIIRSGRMSGTLTGLRHLTRTTVIAEIARHADGLARVPGVLDPQLSEGRVQFQVESDHLDDAIRHLSEHGIRSLVSHPPTLEELFLRQYGDDAATHEAVSR